MKKFLFSLCTLMMVGIVAVSAQTQEDIDAMLKRKAKLEKLCKKTPKGTGDAQTDAYVMKVFTSATLAIEITGQLEGMHKRSIGETKDGVTDVKSGKPTKAELKTLSETIATQALLMTALAAESTMLAKAAKENSNPMLAAKLTKAIASSAGIYSVLAEETIAQGAAIADMIKTASTANNL